MGGKKIEEYKDKIIFQEIALEKTASILSGQQNELEKIKEELNLAQKGLDKKTRDLEKTITAEKEKRTAETKSLEEKINQAEIKSVATESARKAQEESAQNKISAPGGKNFSNQDLQLVFHYLPVAASYRQCGMPVQIL